MRPYPVLGANMATNRLLLFRGVPNMLKHCNGKGNFLYTVVSLTPATLEDEKWEEIVLRVSR